MEEKGGFSIRNGQNQWWGAGSRVLPNQGTPVLSTPLQHIWAFRPVQYKEQLVTEAQPSLQKFQKTNEFSLKIQDGLVNFALNRQDIWKADKKQNEHEHAPAPVQQRPP